MKKVTFKDFPDEIKEWMGDQQELQGNERDLSVFENSISARKMIKGFDWGFVGTGYYSLDSYDFCYEVLIKQKFDLFFKHFPKKRKMKIVIKDNGHKDFRADALECISEYEKKHLNNKAECTGMVIWGLEKNNKRIGSISVYKTKTQIKCEICIYELPITLNE